jgi:hypothetical protein
LWLDQPVIAAWRRHAQSIFLGSVRSHVLGLQNVAMSHSIALALLMVPAQVATSVGSLLLRRALRRSRLLAEELALAGAWVFVVGGLVWLQAFLTDSTLLGFGSPWTWLAASHFAAAGFGALTVTALCRRTVCDPLAQRKPWDTRQRRKRRLAFDTPSA